ncbi:MAG: phage tail sheath subtilisin-like domain-containing protein [Bacteroidales bacterium]|nr:phage tail sheath subtilisin-like domain-containing protein [Bacteroidales bacterium]
MATSYKTPGVYVEEIPKFPPSIAPVETAIPAFVGYTEKAVRNGETLLKKPTRIESLAEYEELFGGPPSQNVEVFLNGDNAFVRSQAESMLYLFDSLRMFYANGGGKCYIVSVGAYPSAPSGILAADIESGLLELEKEDEPTIILMPEAVSVSGGPYSLQQKALTQSAKLMDRVTLCDLEKATDATAFNSKVTDFRNGVGINDLKYGAAYGPWINANLPRQLRRKNLILKRDGTNAAIQLESLTTDAAILKLLSDVVLAEGGGAALDVSETTISGAPGKTLGDALQSALDAYRLTDGTTSAANLGVALQGFTNLTLAILKAVQDINTTVYPVDTQFKIKEAITKYLENPSLKNSMKKLAANHLFIAQAPAIVLINTASANWNPSAVLLGYADGAALLADVALGDVAADYVGATTNKLRADVARNAAYAACGDAIAIFRHVEKSTDEFERSLNNALVVSFGKFKELTTKGAEALNLLPPGGAIAGIYAKTDNERGVWKAPANVSLSSVIGPAVKISHEQQAEYNVDVNSGKSVNIIRSFTGKGTLVWGARTLAGNDNEWRYVNVRRFFNFVEESVKKATEQFVFEPNDANTWVKVQAMIENFLTTLWRQGALQGIKPEHAFYVAVGLGKTMTALDILEGRMIIEIGMAAVRPAEFIILRFSHKMAES